VSSAKRGGKKASERPIMFYDGDCRLCTLTARLVLAVDTGKRVRSATIDSPEADRYLSRLSKKKRYGAFHLYRDGRVLSGADAIPSLLELLPPISPAGRWLGRSERARSVTERLYEGITRRRAAIGRFLPRVGPPPR
jgi:predicted DCC family thiol-disulfide oxidoreductase YuxK